MKMDKVAGSQNDEFYTPEYRALHKSFFRSTIKDLLTEQIREVRGRMKRTISVYVEGDKGQLVHAESYNECLLDIITYLEEGLTNLK